MMLLKQELIKRQAFKAKALLLLLALATTPSLKSQVKVKVKVDSVPLKLQSISAKEPNAGFRRVPSPHSGVLFTNILTHRRATTNQIYLNGSGVAVGDVNGDRLPDLYFAGIDSPNHFYINQGSMRFKEQAKSSGLELETLGCTGVLWLDTDGD